MQLRAILYICINDGSSINEKVMEGLIGKINEVIWPPLYIVVFLAGIYFTLKSRGLQFTSVRKVVNFLLGKDNSDKKEDKQNLQNEVAFSPLQAVATSLSGAVGTGNVVGITTAILTGGPGAIFWVWVLCLIGMILKYVEIVIAMKFRTKNENNETCGGPMFYISNGLKSNFGGKLFALFIVLASFIGGNVIQINSIASITKKSFPIANIELIVGIVLAVLFVFIILKGTKAIGKISEIMTPIFCGGYIIFAIAVIAFHYKNIPHVFSLIFDNALDFKSLTGGTLGYSILTAMRYGIARGVGCGEIGMGTGAIAHGSSLEKDPYKEGLLGIFEVFISCFVVCTCSVFVMLISDVSIPERYNAALISGGLESLENLDCSLTLLTNSFVTILGNSGANIFMWICIFLFAYTTVIGYYFYGVRCYEYVFGCKTSLIYKIAFLAVIVLSPFLKGGLVWQMNDIANGLLLAFNIVAVFLLRKKFFNRDES